MRKQKRLGLGEIAIKEVMIEMVEVLWWKKV
jgi:hypothetical protein